MSKLKKEDFNKEYKFRERRTIIPSIIVFKETMEDFSKIEKLVNCASCAHKTEGSNNKEGTAFCEHPNRVKKVKIAEYWPGFYGTPGDSKNISSKMVLWRNSSFANVSKRSLRKILSIFFESLLYASIASISARIPIASNS